MNKNYLTGYKLVFALLGFSALITEVAATVERGSFTPANFFSFFTVESNIIAVIALLVGAFAVYANKKSIAVDSFRGAATLYMVVTGVVFALLLSGIEGVALTAVPWDNIVLHYIMPIAVALDWIMNPPSRRIEFKKALWWLVFPLAYLAYSLARGPIANWYPYPFLNPANGGYGQIAVTSALILVFGVVLVYVVTRIGRPAVAKKK